MRLNFTRTAILLALLLMAVGLNGQRRRSRKNKKGSLVCHLKDVEKCLETLAALSNRENPSAIIASSEGLDRFCGTIRTKFNGCVKDYFKKCGTPLHRELSGLVMDQLLSHTTALCNKGPMRDKFLKASPCLHEKVFSRAQAKEECNGRYVATLNKAARNDSLPGICCGYRHWEDCAGRLVAAECGSQGTEALRFLVKTAFLDLPELTCPKHAFPLSSDECRAALAPKDKAKRAKLNTGEAGVGKYNIAHVFGFMFAT